MNKFQEWGERILAYLGIMTVFLGIGMTILTLNPEHFVPHAQMALIFFGAAYLWSGRTLWERAAKKRSIYVNGKKFEDLDKETKNRLKDLAKKEF